MLIASRSHTTGPSPRWGQSAVYLEQSNVVLFVGGQTAANGTLTNDVYALDVAAAKNHTSNKSNSWVKLSSDGLDANAFAAAVVSPGSPGNSSEQVFIIGGAVEDCDQAAPLYVWTSGNTTDGKGWMQGTWSSPNVTSPPVRRRGAKAVLVSESLATKASGKAASNGTAEPAILVLGGRADESTCYKGPNLVKKSNPNADYLGMDFWQVINALEGDSSKAPMQTPLLAMEMGARPTSVNGQTAALPLLNYALVRIPGAAPDGSEDRILFLGGRDASGKYSSFNKFWVLDVKTGEWQQWDSTGDIPSGRAGHSATLMPDGNLLMHGGYSDANGDGKSAPTSDTYILNINQTPAQWSQPTYASSGKADAPARAFHSAVMAGDVLVVGFGVDGWQHGATPNTAAETRDMQSIYFLDTSSAKGWSWTQVAPDALAATPPSNDIASSTDSQDGASQNAPNSASNFAAQGPVNDGQAASASSSSPSQGAQQPQVDGSSAQQGSAAGPCECFRANEARDGTLTRTHCFSSHKRRHCGTCESDWKRNECTASQLSGECRC